MNMDYERNGMTSTVEVSVGFVTRITADCTRVAV